MSAITEKEREKEELIKKKLKEVIDPETNLDVVTMKLVRDIVYFEDTGTLFLTFRPSSPVCPLAFKLALDIKEACLQVEGVREVRMDVENFVYREKLLEVVND